MSSNVNFIGIGAQKAGTSWLFNQFGKSKQFQLPPIKELHYFDRYSHYESPNVLVETKLVNRLLQPKWVYRAFNRCLTNLKQIHWFTNYFFSNYTDEWYLSLFNNFDKCTGEITPAYAILQEEDVSRMSQLLGHDTKIIFMLRHPLHRAWSSYKYKYKITNFSDKDIPHAKKYILSQEQQQRSSYTKTISLYKRYFNSIALCFFDAILENPTNLLQGIFTYLNLDASEIELFTGVEERINTSRKMAIPKEIQEMLNEMYRDEIAALASQYGGYFIKWKNPNEYDHVSDINCKPCIII